jgi:hypothetical protein
MPDQNDFEARINAEVEAGLAAEVAAKREELAYQARRRATAAEYDRINARAPIEDKYGGLTREQHEARLKAMSERAAKANMEMDIANRRPVEGDLRAQRAAKAGGGSGFTIK